jgi:hypothetical protein
MSDAVGDVSPKQMSFYQGLTVDALKEGCIIQDSTGHGE